MPTPEHSPTEEIKQQTRPSGPRTRVRSGTRIKGTRSPDLFVFLKETESKTKATERKFRAPLSIDPQLRTLRSFSSRSLGAFLRGSSFFFSVVTNLPSSPLSLYCLSFLSLGLPKDIAFLHIPSPVQEKTNTKQTHEHLSRVKIRVRSSSLKSSH